MHPDDCPSWEYSRVPNYSLALRQKLSEVLVQLRRGLIDALPTAQDTRSVHRTLFQALTPPDCLYYAGHYRGENFRCLQHYKVHVPGDTRVGFPPQVVAGYMLELSGQIREGLAALDEAAKLPGGQFSEEDKVLFVVMFACRVFEAFLRIHPYANGNGHLGRFLI